GLDDRDITGFGDSDQHPDLSSPIEDRTPARIARSRATAYPHRNAGSALPMTGGNEALLALPVDPDLAADEASCPRRSDELMAGIVHDFDPIRDRPVQCEPRAVAARSECPATGRHERLHSAAPDPCLDHLN